MKITGIKRSIPFILAVFAGFQLCSCKIKTKETDTNASASAEATVSETAADTTTYTTEKATETTEADKAFDIVTLADYADIVVEDPDVTDAEVISKIKKMLTNFAEADCDDTVQTAEKYDNANIDYAGYINGVQFEGGTAAGTDLMLGSGTFVPGFEDQVIGMTVGETKDVLVTFPENYRSEEYAGKDAKFVVTLNKLTRYEINEKNVRLLSYKDDTTVEAYKDYIKRELRLSQLTDEVWEKYIGICTFAELDKDKLEEYKTSKKTNDEQYAAYYGVSLSEYTGMSDDEYSEYISKYAENRYKNEAVTKAIIKQENLVLTDEEYEESVVAYALEFGVSPDQFKQYYSEGSLTAAFLNDKAIKFAAEHATIKEPEKE